MGAGRVPTSAAAAAAKQSSVGLGMHAAVDAVAGHRLLPCHCNPHDLQACAMKTFGENLLREFHGQLRLLVAGLASVCASQHRPHWPGPAKRQSVGTIRDLARQIVCVPEFVSMDQAHWLDRSYDDHNLLSERPPVLYAYRPPLLLSQ